jgi:hypothetical protein
MVTPKLKFGNWERRELQGRVLSSYANPFFVRDTCTTPLADVDSLEAGYSCLNIQYAGQCKSLSMKEHFLNNICLLTLNSV